MNSFPLKLLLVVLLSYNNYLLLANDNLQVALSHSINGPVERVGNTTLYTFPMRYKVENVGTENIVELLVLNELAADFNLSLSDIFIETAPSIIYVTPGSFVNPSTSYTGVTPNHNLLDTGNCILLPGHKVTIQVQVTLNVGVFGSTALTQSLAVAFDEAQNTDLDWSDEGNVPDPFPYDGSPGDGEGEDDKTTVIFLSPVQIGLAQQVNGELEQLDSTTYRIPFRYRIQNLGQLDLVSVNLENDFAANLGIPASSINIHQAPEIISLNAGSSLQLNPNFTGVAPNHEFFLPTGNFLEAGDKATIQLWVDIDFGTDYGLFTNQSSIFVQDANGISGADLSDDGKLMDEFPEDMDFGGGIGENDKTEFFFSPPFHVGVSHWISDPIRQHGNSTKFEIPIRIKVQNLGDVDITQLSIQNDLAINLNIPKEAVQIVTNPQIVFISEGSTLPLKPNYLGHTYYTEMIKESYTLLKPGHAAIISLKVAVDVGVEDGSFTNQIRVVANDIYEQEDIDLSDEGTKVDEKKNDNNPGSGPLENDPTIIEVGKQTHLGLALEQNQPIEKDGNTGQYIVPFKYHLQNFGETDFVQLDLRNDLAKAFGLPASAIQINQIPQLVYASPGTTLQMNPNYTGFAPNDNLLLASGNHFETGDKAAIQIYATINFDTNIGTFSNQASLAGEDENGIQDFDLSDAGKVKDENKLDHIIASGPTENDPTLFSIDSPAQIAVALQLKSISPLSPTVHEMTFRYRVSNLGQTDFTRVELRNNLAAELGLPISAINIQTAPTLIHVTNNSTIQVNPDYTGTIPNDNLLASTGNRLNAGDKYTIDLTISVDFGIAHGQFTNQAIAIGEDETNNMDIDFSDEGKIVDENSDDYNIGTGATENDPTVINLGNSDEAKPNVLFFMIDDINDWIGCYGGHPDAYTPNMDQLAAEGIKFQNAQANAVFCNPSRVSVITGLKPSSSGIYDNGIDFEHWRRAMRNPNLEGVKNFGPNAGNVKTIFEVFEDHNYHLATTGKIFHSEEQTLAEPWNQINFFDNKLYFGNINNSPLNGLTNYTKGNNKANDWGAVENALQPLSNLPYTEEDTEDFQITEQTLQIIENLPPDDPFFLSVGFIRPHIPLYVPQRYLDMYKDANGEYDVALPQDILVNDQDDVPLPTTMRHYTSVFQHTDRWKSLVAHYLAAITWVDDQIGIIINELETKNLLDNTIIVLCSDHGYTMGEKQYFKKGTLWRESTDVPLIIKAPGITTPNSSTDSIVSLIDIFPTLVDLAGINMPNDIPRDGRSLMPLIDNPTTRWPWLASTDYVDPKRGYKSKGLRSTSTSYKLYELDNPFPPDFRSELYDLSIDPHEWYNQLSSVHGEPFIHEEAEKELKEKIEGQLMPNKAPLCRNKAKLITDASFAFHFTIEADDPNKDHLLFSIKQLPRFGSLYLLQPGSSVATPITETSFTLDESTSRSVDLIYLASTDAPLDAKEDIVIFEATDGAYRSRGFVSLTYDNNSFRMPEPRLHETIQDFAFSLYPNPAQDQLTVNWEEDGNASIAIFNVAGQLVNYIDQAENGQSINIKHLNQGTYFMNVNIDGKIKQEQFIKM